jgi:hypothetical protein
VGRIDKRFEGSQGTIEALEDGVMGVERWVMWEKVLQELFEMLRKGRGRLCARRSVGSHERLVDVYCLELTPYLQSYPNEPCDL